MKGRRIYPPREQLPVKWDKTLEPGDYARWKDSWIICSPSGDLAFLQDGSFRVVEHYDGTITVESPIQFMSGSRWYGYLENGVWRKHKAGNVLLGGQKHVAS